MRLRPLRVACVLLLGASHCGTASPAAMPVCKAGESVACTGPGGCSTNQVCKADGSGYGPCVCAGQDAGVDSALPDSGSHDSSHRDSGHKPDSSSNPDAISDSPVDTGPPCLAWALGGIGVPLGTIASGDTTYASDSASLAIDGNLDTQWSATGTTGTLTLQFPSPQTITGVRFADLSNPATNESYSITAIGSPVVIGTATEMVNGTSTPTIEPAIPVTPGTYDGLVISINGMMSWAGLCEVSLLTKACP